MTAFVEAVVPLAWRLGTLRLVMAIYQFWHYYFRAVLNPLQLLGEEMLIDGACGLRYKVPMLGI